MLAFLAFSGVVVGKAEIPHRRVARIYVDHVVPKILDDWRATKSNRLIVNVPHHGILAVA